jgi:aryl-alcohol dehydrogenase-like predicted oxidoreductase
MTKPRALGKTGIQIAPLVLGGNVFGWTADEARSFELLDRAAAAGLNTIDTADSYSSWVPGNVGGESESILGKWLKRSGRRDATVVITKAGSAVGPYKKDLTARHILAAAEDSLRRLQTDRIDVYFSHWPDRSTPIDETLGAYQTLIRQGKVRAIGASNYSAEELHEALEAARKAQLPRYEVVQPEYNLYNRGNFEGGLREFCVREELGVITYFSLASGFLTGKYRSPADFSRSPRGQMIGKYLDARGLRILNALDSLAQSQRASQSEIALAWLMAQVGVTAPIASATSVEQLEALIRATQLTLSPADLKALNAASS